MSENKAIVQTASNGVGIARPTIQSGDMIDSGWRMAQFAAQSSLIKTDNPFDAFFIIQYGWELGLTPMASLRTIYIVNGVPTCSGEAMLALIRRSGLCEKLEIKGDATKAIVTMSRKDTNETFECTFTIEDANRAQLTSKAVWKQYPAKMLKWRAVSECAKFLFGDIIGGLYTVEEIVPHANINDAGELIDHAESDIVVDTKPSSKTIAPDFSGNGNKKTEPEPEPEADKQTETIWQDDVALVRQLVSNAVEAGFIERPAKIGDGKAALLQLIGKKDFNDFTTFDDASNVIKTEGEKLQAELNNRNANKSQADEPEATTSDSTGTTTATGDIATLSNKDKAALADWIKENFAGRDMASVSQELETDWSEYSTIGFAKNALIKKATEECWTIITDMISHKQQGKASYLLFHSPIDEIRIYSRKDLVTMLGTDFPDNDKITALPVGESLLLTQKIAVSFEAKGHYNNVTAAVHVDQYIPF
jgi:hypothetical protein